MLGDVNYDPNKSIDDYDEFTCDATLVLLEYSFGKDQVCLVEEGEDYILVEADEIFKVHGKKRMREELNNLNLRWGYHFGKSEGYSNDVICIYTKEAKPTGLTRYDLLQTLEMIFPNKEGNDAWFVANENEGIVKIAFVVDIEGDEDG